MTRRTRNLRTAVLAGWTVAVLLGSSAAQAVTELYVTDIAVTSGYVYGNAVILPVGESVTIGSRFVETVANETRWGIGLSYFGYDDSVIGFDSGAVVANVYSDFCAPAFGCLGGMENWVGTLSPFAQTVAAPSQVGQVSGPTRVRVLSTGAFGGAQTNPANDVGLDGLAGNPNGDAHFRLTFEGLSDGITEIEIGTGDDLGGAIFDELIQPNQAARNATVRIAVPEAGFALGLGVSFGVAITALRASRRRG